MSKDGSDTNGNTGGPKVMSEEEYHALLNECGSDNEVSKIKTGAPEEVPRKPRRLKVISLKDVVLIGGLALAAAGMYRYHGQINEATGCYLSPLSDNVCFVQKKGRVKGETAYELRTGDDLVQAVYNAEANTMSISQDYIDRELKRESLDVNEAMSSLYQNSNNRKQATWFVIQNMTEDDIKSNGRNIADRLYQADSKDMQEIVLEGLANNPVENKEALVAVGVESVKRYPAEVAQALSNEDILDEARRRGSDIFNSLYEIVMGTAKDQYNRLFGDGAPKPETQVPQTAPTAPLTPGVK
ncbi:MAG: hypothetical protein NT001_03640 [Candidatus Woesearchaeota archaeon]|nr:hypothetical protein [Candidatus Woesearchaeota archaeon]